MSSPADARVVEIDVLATHDLRRRVLRDATPSPALDWPGDDAAGTVHLGVELGGQIVAISTWLLQPSPDVPADSEHLAGIQVRGMATDPSPATRGSGYGSMLLRAGIHRASASGANHVWANARTSALEFYRSHGFVVTSDEFISIETAIPHRRILLRFD